MTSPTESRPSLAQLVWTPVGLLVSWILLMWVIVRLTYPRRWMEDLRDRFDDESDDEPEPED